MALSPTDLDLLRSSVTLSTLIRQTIDLKKVGQEWKALCPFHEEKTPSFIVSDIKGYYHCFGCGAHGDAIKWLMDKEKMSFKEAVFVLQKQTGVKFREAAEPPLGRKIAAPKSGGGKLSRSETVTVRLDPKLNYLCELGARAQRRTKSSFIEWAIANSLEDVDVPASGWNNEPLRLAHQAEQLWRVDEPDRVAALALTTPSLMTHEEQLIWRFVRENGFLWRGKYGAENRWVWDIKEDNLILERLRTHWDAFRQVALEGADEELLPKWQEFRHSLDDDLPF